MKTEIFFIWNGHRFRPHPFSEELTCSRCGTVTSYARYRSQSEVIPPCGGSAPDDEDE